MEEWRAVVGYEGLYEVSDKGNVRRIAPWCDGRRTKPAAKLTGKTTETGYRRISIRKEGAIREFAIHRLVAAAFIGSLPSSVHQVNHKNGKKTDNCVSNLEYLTPSANQLHSFRVLGAPSRPGSKHHNAKVTEKDVLVMRSLWKQGTLQKDLCVRFGLTRGTVSEIVRRKLWTHI
ncbi:MAG: NUMOD4 domain-containing protein [Gemmatimonadales bacterium]